MDGRAAAKRLDAMNLQADDLMPSDIYGCHQRTKHAPKRYALGPAFLDWSSQPSPYRSFEGSRRIGLPLLDDWEKTQFPGPAAKPAPLGARSLGLFLELAFGLSAWKTYEGNSWALRNNPSSGNLHPTEAYVILDAFGGVSETACLYHYDPLGHALEERAIYETAHILPAAGFLLALSSIPWREAWKYGERSFRYCQLDAGHAIGSAAQAAAELGWSAQLLPAPSDDEIAALLGLDRADSSHRREAEHPEALLWIAAEGGPHAEPDPQALTDLPRSFRGSANRLTENHDGWPLVDRAVQLCRKPRQTAYAPTAPQPKPAPAFEGVSICEAVRRRRSAQSMDGETILPNAAFSATLAAILPGSAPLLAAFPWPARVTPILFVHRVDGLDSGLYALERDAEIAKRLRAACSADFEWSPIDLDGLPLFRLRKGSFEKEATRTSCLQAIAGKGCFSLAMIADFDRTLGEDGGFGYRRLHWEAGLIGQALYLWATAAGFSGTGVGCFFDDEVHALLGLTGGQTQFQDVYHFTVGAAVEDPRLLTLPPYPDARRERR